MILLAATSKSDRAAYALMFRQLAATAKAIHDMHKATGDLQRVRGLSASVIAATKAVEGSAPGRAPKAAQPERMTMEKLRERHLGLDEETLRARLFVERTREGTPVPSKLTRGQKPTEHAAPARGPEQDRQRGTPEMIEGAHETAEAWKGHDPIAAEHAGTIRDQVQDRYGIDVNNPGATEQDISSAVTQAQTARQQAENERSNAPAAARGVEVIAGAAMASANREDRARASNSAGSAYDAPERRQQLAKSLEDHPDREAVNARLIADRHQGTPPSAAVNSKSTVGKTSKMKTPSIGRIIERGGLGR